MTLAILLLSRSGGPTHDASFFTPQYDFWRSVFTKMAFCQMLVSWNQSSFKKMQPMAAAEVALKSPLIPFFQRGNYSIAVLTPLWKRGEGEISTRRYGNYLTNFNSRTLDGISLRKHHRQEQSDPGCSGDGQEGGADDRYGAHYRRQRHRKRVDCPCHSRSWRQERQTISAGQLRRLAGDVTREFAFWPHERFFHRGLC